MKSAVVLALLAGSLVAGLAVGPPGAAAHATSPTRHYIANLRGSTAPQRLGYDVFDVDNNPAAIDALPDGVQAMVWLGQLCPTPADDAFKATVQGLATDPKVYGYFLADEPHSRSCPDGPTALASRADFIKQVTGGTQKSMIALYRNINYKAFRPAVSHVDLFGIDPYPCSTSHPTCDLSLINNRVHAARARGISLKRIVPVYQAFGQSARTVYHFYNLPTVTQMKAMLKRWHTLVPHPQLDFTYSWGHQPNADPTLRDSLGLRHLFKRYLAG
ncbi:MAG: hypothetical protein ACXVXG_06095 [Nocardioidaceae bacterium]